MQVSLPVSPSPEPAAPTTAAGTGKSLAAAPADDSAAASFEAYLPADKAPAKKPTDSDVGSDAEQAAAILAAALWQPIVPPAVPPPVAAPEFNLAAAPAGPTAPTTPLATAADSRTFAPMVDATAGLKAGEETATKPGATDAGQPKKASLPPTAEQSADATMLPLRAAKIRPPQPVARSNSEVSTGETSDALETDLLAQAVSGSAPATQPASSTPAPTVAPVGQEKIAAAGPGFSMDSNEKNPGDKKEFLSADHKSVSGSPAAIGIGTAQGAGNMTSAPSTRTKTAAAPSAMVSAVTVTTAAAGSLAPEAAVPAATLRETMAAVVSAVETLENREATASKSVDLHFQVGAEKLGLRVELRDGTLHTTFRTDSPELRSALAQEWHTMVPALAGREISVAQPVFSTTPAGAADAGYSALGEGASQRREQPAPERAAFPLSPERADDEPSVATPTRAASPSVSSLLNAFA